MSNSYSDKVSECCSARLDWNDNGSFYICSTCKQGSWPDGVNYYYKYFPSDYEKGLEKRILDLENRMALMEIKR